MSELAERLGFSAFEREHAAYVHAAALGMVNSGKGNSCQNASPDDWKRRIRGDGFKREGEISLAQFHVAADDGQCSIRTLRELYVFVSSKYSEEDLFPGCVRFAPILRTLRVAPSKCGVRSLNHVWDKLFHGCSIADLRTLRRIVHLHSRWIYFCAFSLFAEESPSCAEFLSKAIATSDVRSQNVLRGEILAFAHHARLCAASNDAKRLEAILDAGSRFFGAFEDGAWWTLLASALARTLPSSDAAERVMAQTSDEATMLFRASEVIEFGVEVVDVFGDKD